MFKKNENIGETSVQALSTIISEQCSVTGNIESSQSVKIDGNVEGNVVVRGLTVISEKAEIVGDVLGGEVIVYGRISGNIRCESLQIKAGGHVEGEIVTGNLQVEAGAVYRGNISMKQDESLNINQSFDLSESDE